MRQQQVACAPSATTSVPLRNVKAALSTRPLVKSRRVCVRPVAFKAGDAVEEHHPTWLKDELRNLVVGLQKSTRTANIRTVGLRSCNVSTNTESLTGKNRCEQLELEVEWEGDYHPTKKAEQQNQRKLSGLARVSMNQEDSCDQVKVRDVRVTKGGEDLAGDPRATQDVVMAVESMDSVVMERLNEFLWDVEKSTAQSAATSV